MGMTFSIIGLGKLGASYAAAIASRGYDVIGVDVNQRTVDLVNEGRAPVQETDLEKTIASNKARIHATLSHQEAILNSDLTFVIVPTPSDEKGAFSLQYAAWAFKEIGKALAVKRDYHNVVLTSTVLPGATRYGLLPILELESGKAAGSDFGVCYSPEFIALGSIIHDFLNPDFTLIGEIDDRAGSQLEECYAKIMENNPPCKRMNIENAELTKIAINVFVTIKITFANMLANICEQISNGDVDAVTDALGTDKRIGHKYLKGGLGYGGPCFPRDNIAFAYLARAVGVQADLAEVTDRYNRALPIQHVGRLGTLIKPGATIAILGLAYKPCSHITEESQGILLAKALSNNGYRVVAYDPLANEMAKVELHDHAVIMDSIESCLNKADMVLITTPDPVFKALKAADFTRQSSTVTIVDYWRILKKELSCQPHIHYVPMGQSIENENNIKRLIKLWGEDYKNLNMK
jgi:UDPglucose 6-dehydrogenase